MRHIVGVCVLGLLGCATEERRGGPAGEALGVATSAIVVREHAKLLGPEDDLNNFGREIALEGSTALIGDFRAGPLDGSGIVHSFVRTGGTWQLGQSLVPSTPHTSAHLGWSVSLSGDSAFIGAPSDSNDGATFVWNRTAGVWVEGQRLEAGDSTVGMSFGASVALAGDVAVIGAPGDDTMADDTGAAYVFTRAGGVWSEVAKLVPSDGVPQIAFGERVAIQGDTIAIGAPAFDADLPGRAYAFQKRNDVWVEQRLAIDGAARDFAGGALSLAGDRLFVGAPGYGVIEPTGLAGKVFVFERQGGVFGLTTTLAAPSPTADDGFGYSLAFTGDRLAVGVPGADIEATNDGAVVMFEQGASGWGTPTPYVSSDQRNGLGFGKALAATATTLLVDVDDVFVDVVYTFAIIGPACAVNDDCEIGYCVDGVCCESACNGACQTCAAAGQEGLCGVEAASTPDPLCGVYVCGEGGACKSTCASTADCADGHACNAEGTCVPAPKSNDDGPSDGDGADGEGEPEADGCGVGAGSPGGTPAWIALFFLLATLRRAIHRARA